MFGVSLSSGGEAVAKRSALTDVQREAVPRPAAGQGDWSRPDRGRRPPVRGRRAVRRQGGHPLAGPARAVRRPERRLAALRPPVRERRLGGPGRSAGRTRPDGAAAGLHDREGASGRRGRPAAGRRRAGEEKRTPTAGVASAAAGKDRRSRSTPRSMRGAARRGRGRRPGNAGTRPRRRPCRKATGEGRPAPRSPTRRSTRARSASGCGGCGPGPGFKPNPRRKAPKRHDKRLSKHRNVVERSIGTVRALPPRGDSRREEGGERPGLRPARRPPGRHELNAHAA